MNQLFYIVLCYCCLWMSVATTWVPRISVRGEGIVTVVPDTATITIGVSSDGKTARDALTKNNQDMKRVLAEMKALGIQERDLQTLGFRLHPSYSYKKDPPQIAGYQVSNDLTVTIRDIDATGQVLDKAVSLGINNILNNVRFSNSNLQEILQEARRQAVKDAKEKAETIVRELGFELGAIYSISEGQHQEVPVGMPMAAMRGMGLDAGSVPIAGGENSYRVAVDISWEIDTNSCSGKDLES